MKTLRSWNGIPKARPAHVRWLSGRDGISLSTMPEPLLAYGCGRSYGDVCLNDSGTALMTRGLDKFIDFDSQSGILRCEAGVTLAEILELFVPRGWFLPVTPGTKYVTVGGAIANDVHGKNHHVAGSFGDHVLSFVLLRSDGSSISCSASENSDYFSATIGGLGLTGLITSVSLKLMPIASPWVWMQTRRFASLAEYWDLNQAAEGEWPYTVAWVDCAAKGDAIGRGVFIAGRHCDGPAGVAQRAGTPLRVPFELPFSLINSATLRAFNAAYYRKRVYPDGVRAHYDPFFYPLDAIGNWNRIYGRKGFYQYQCVVPPGMAREVLGTLLREIAKSRQGSFLAVLKTFGNRTAPGMLSFPRPGTTLALDFSERGEHTAKLFRRLDAVIKEAGGAIYPAKDARMPAALFRSGFPQWESFSRYIDPKFSSDFWRRVSV